MTVTVTIQGQELSFKEMDELTMSERMEILPHVLGVLGQIDQIQADIDDKNITMETYRKFSALQETLCGVASRHSLDGITPETLAEADMRDVNMILYKIGYLQSHPDTIPTFDEVGGDVFKEGDREDSQE